MHRVVDLLRDGVDFACVEIRARLRPSQRALRMTAIEQELRVCRGELIVLSMKLGLLQVADDERRAFDDIAKRLEGSTGE